MGYVLAGRDTLFPDPGRNATASDHGCAAFGPVGQMRDHRVSRVLFRPLQKV